MSTDELAKISGIHPRSFRDWRREKLTVSLEAAKRFCQLFAVNLPEEAGVMVERWKRAKKEASRKGGISRFKKHGSPGTPEGRRKGGMMSVANLQKNGIIPKVKIYKLPLGLNEELAEYVGIMLGDGGITNGQCTITLNRIEDGDYVKFVMRFTKALFGEEPKQMIRKDSKAIVLYYNGFLLIRYLVSIGLKIGNKVKQQVDVPSWIKNSEQYRISCLRGLMDTDGGVFLHRYKVNKKEYRYKKISFSNRSVPLLIFVRDTLQSLGFTPKVIDKVENKKVWLYNMHEVERYLQVVKTNNSRLLKHNK